MDIVLDGNVGIARSGEIWSLLKEGVASGKTVTIRWEGLLCLDASILQLLLAAKKAAAEKILFSTPPPQIAKIIMLSGMKDSLIP